MGIILCEDHGRTGIMTGVLDEICVKMLKDEYIDPTDFATVAIDYFDGDELLFSDKYLVTKEFKKKYEVRDHYEIYSDEDEEHLLKPFKSKIGVICGKCYEDYLKRHGIDTDPKSMT
jgi:hypothetical protein